MSREAATVLRFSERVANLLRHRNYLSVSSKLLQAGLISKRVDDHVRTDTNSSDKEKVNKILKSVTSTGDNTKWFHDFINILKDDAVFNDIVSAIEGRQTI